MKKFTCKTAGCGFQIEGNSPSVMIPHSREVHGARIGGRPGKRGANGTAAARRKRNACDAELALLNACAALFSEADTDRDADQRVLEYLASRWGPAAYDGVDDNPPQDEP